MKKEISNNYAQTRLYAQKIKPLETMDIPKAAGTSTVSNGGRTAQYSDSIIDDIDNELNIAFKTLFINSRKKLNDIADAFEAGDINASV